MSIYCIWNLLAWTKPLVLLYTWFRLPLFYTIVIPVISAAILHCNIWGQSGSLTTDFKCCDLGGDLSSCGIKILTGNIQTIVFCTHFKCCVQGVINRLCGNESLKSLCWKFQIQRFIRNTIPLAKRIVLCRLAGFPIYAYLFSQSMCYI